MTSCSVSSEEIRWLSETRPALMLCKKKSSRLVGGTEVTSSKATRGDWKRCNRLLGNAMERGASWSQQLDGNFAKRTPDFWISHVFMAIRPVLHRMVC